jgi:sodium/proline symporter
MDILFLMSFIIYLGILAFVGFLFYRKQKNASDFMVGSRSVNYWVTAIATHATDMSTWLFMAFPGMVYRKGVFAFWVAIGLGLGMHFVWKFIAPKLRQISEEMNCTTIPSFFENRFNDTSGTIRLISALMAVIFFTFYISAGIVGIGRTIQATFSIDYQLGIVIGTTVVALYTLLGGFIAVAWNDFLQGMFVLVVIIFVPIFATVKAGGIGNVINVLNAKEIPLSLFPDYSFKTISSIVTSMFGWGLGYFGMPHILVNFMGIDKTENIKKAHIMGISWHIFSLTAAASIGLIGVAFFNQGLMQSEFVFIEMAKSLFPSFISGFVLCAILAAATSTMDSQILVSASTIAEDLYKKFFNSNISSERLLTISRIAGCVVTLVSFVLAFNNNEMIVDLVYYAWAGLGGAFGPLIIVSLHSKFATRQGAIAGILVGGTTAALWPHLPFETDKALALIPAFVLSLTSIYLVSAVTRKK